MCIGDRYRIGSALFEVTQPRVTCYRVGIRMNEPRMPALLTSSGRPGFYFRVLQPGEVGAGDDIVKVGEATERMTVAEINALLYSPDHPRDRLERALRIEALSPGWRSSFEALLQSQTDVRGEWQRGTRAGCGGTSGGAGISAARGDGNRSRVRGRPVADDAEPRRSATARGSARSVRGRASSPTADGPPPPEASAPKPLFRSYSLSGPQSTERYRISVKIEPNGAAGTYLRDHVRVGDALDVSAPRGSFILQSGERPVVLLSAGIGATPVLAMLHALAAARSTRQVFWLHGARDRQHHPFAAEVAAPRARAPARPQLCVLQQAGLGRHEPRISTPPATCRDWSSTKSAFHERRTSTSAGRLVSWQR